MVMVKDTPGCSTRAVRELDRQLIFKLSSFSLLVTFEDLNVAIGEAVWPYLQPPAKEALRRAINERGRQMIVNSAYRTVAQQLMLFNRKQQNRCGISAAARPPLSNHQSGLALDIEDADGWEPFLERHGWRRLGAFDPVHFDYIAGVSRNLSKPNVQAFQELWNLNNPGDQLVVDGIFGPQTELRLSRSPAEGFPIGQKIPDIQPSLGDVPRVLRLTQPNMEGNDVRKLQEALVAAGISVAVDGFFGPATDLAVRKFQELKGLSIDGIVGPGTLEILGLAPVKLPEESRTLADIVNNSEVIDLDTLTSDRELVKEIQTRLSDIGLLELSSTDRDIDGIFGPATKAALTRFCEVVFLNNMSTGLFGPTFAKKLIEFRGPVEMNNPTESTPSGRLPDAIETALKFTLKWEGGFVNHRLDPGGATNKGITQRTYDSYRIGKALTTKSVELIADSEVRDIYYTMYWKPSRAELTILPLAVALFDSSVLFGVKGAIKFLQEALAVTSDGIFGSETETSLRTNNNKQTAIKLIDRRIAFHRRRVAQSPSQNVFLQGWLNRANALKTFVDSL